MTDKARFRAVIDEARRRMAASDFAGARALLEGIQDDPARGALGPETALGLPRPLHAAYLKLAKSEGDGAARIAYQYHLVPPPERLAGLLSLTKAEKREAAALSARPVPRIIHQVWIGDRPPPETTEAWQAWAGHSGYAYRLWRESDLRDLGIATDPVYAAFRGRGDFPGAVDVARYAILRSEGGIYLDCDWYPARRDVAFHERLPMTGLVVMAEEIPRLTGMGSLLLANSFIAAPPAHPVFGRVLAALPEVLAAIPGAPAWWTTGPLAFTLAARCGPVALADAGLVAGKAPPGATVDDLARISAEAETGDGGFLIAWKPWAA